MELVRNEETGIVEALVDGIKVGEVLTLGDVVELSIHRY